MDYNSTTPVDTCVVEAMLPYFTEFYGNPSSIHHFGQKAQSGVDMARFRVSQLIGANIDEIIFTSGGTEANNFALNGLRSFYKKGKNHIITSLIEHSSVYNQCKKLEEQGVADITYLPVDDFGQVTPKSVEDAVNDNTVLVSVMLANNEYGTVQRLKEIAEIATKYGVMTHTDAVQAVGKIPVDVNELGVDMLSISAHKIYGPKGIGALYVRRGIKLEPHHVGGGQESKRRSGTENVPAIVGFGKACEEAKESLVEYMERLTKLRERLEHGILNNIPGAIVNGAQAARTPNTSNISFVGQENETLVVQLDLEGIAVSSGSACGEAHRVASRSLRALGIPTSRIYSAVRFSLGKYTTESDVDRVISTLEQIVTD